MTKEILLKTCFENIKFQGKLLDRRFMHKLHIRALNDQRLGERAVKDNVMSEIQMHLYSLLSVFV